MEKPIEDARVETARREEQTPKEVREGTRDIEEDNEDGGYRRGAGPASSSSRSSYSWASLAYERRCDDAIVGARDRDSFTESSNRFTRFQLVHFSRRESRAPTPVFSSSKRHSLA